MKKTERILINNIDSLIGKKIKYIGTNDGHNRMINFNGHNIIKSIEIGHPDLYRSGYKVYLTDEKGYVKYGVFDLFDFELLTYELI